MASSVDFFEDRSHGSLARHPFRFLARALRKELFVESVEPRKPDNKPRLPLLPLDYGPCPPRQVVKRLKYASFVSTEHGVAYVETPKAACTVLKWILATIDGRTVPEVHCAPETSLSMRIHHRTVHPLPSFSDFSGEQAAEILQNYRIFCVVRNPFTRLVSAWANKVRQQEPGFSDICHAVAEYSGTPANADISFRDFAKWVVETNDPQTCNAHWRPQKHLLYPEVVSYTDVLHLETLAEDLQQFFNSIPSLKRYDARDLLQQCAGNESLPVDYSDLYDEELAEAVARFYEVDFATYGYDRNSWKEVNGKRRPRCGDLERAALAAIRQRNQLIELLTKTAAAA